MPTLKKRFRTIDEYTKTFPKNVQAILKKIRQTIRKAAPEAAETISYGIPAFKLKARILVYFAGWKHHVALYPIPAGDEAFRKALSPYIRGKGTVRFPLGESVPYGLVKRVVLFRMKHNQAKKKQKSLPPKGKARSRA